MAETTTTKRRSSERPSDRLSAAQPHHAVEVAAHSSPSNGGVPANEVWRRMDPLPYAPGGGARDTAANSMAQRTQRFGLLRTRDKDLL